MSVESVQCPNCGAPVAVDEGRLSVFCSYCGSSLKISRGASGFPIATLDGIKFDTGLMARDAALRRLEERLAALDAQLQQQEAAWKSDRQAAERQHGTSIIVIALGVLFFLGGLVNLSEGLEGIWRLLLGGGLLLLAFWRGRQRTASLKAVDTAYLKRNTSIEVEATPLRAQVARLKEEMNALTKKL